MKRFIKKPVSIEAIQWKFGDAPVDGMEPYDTQTISEKPQYNGFYFIETLEGIHHVSDGDYIITGVAGEKYPCKPDIFENTYYTEQEYAELGL